MMTFVDVVFPAFLFIVGISVPLALGIRLSKGQSYGEIGKHILIRTSGLVILGVFMVNSEEMAAEPNLISKSWWDVLLYLSAVLIWNRYPKAEGTKRHLFLGLQIVGMLTLAVLALLYPKGDGDILIGMATSWWAFWDSSAGLIFFPLWFIFFSRTISARLLGCLHFLS